LSSAQFLAGVMPAEGMGAQLPTALERRSGYSARQMEAIPMRFLHWAG
jgi:hypothetical protein